MSDFEAAWVDYFENLPWKILDSAPLDEIYADFKDHHFKIFN